MKRLSTQYFQYDQKFITTTFNYKTISEISEVLKYGDDKFGYQREVNQLHLNRMVKTLRSTEEILSPTSIILGVSSNDIDKCLGDVTITPEVDFYNEHEKVLFLDLEKVDFKFRIIDGQHRITAFEKYLSEKDLEEKRKNILMLDYLFNVVIVVLEEEDRIEEVELFRSINSKSKPLKTDLAMLAKYKYELIFRKTDINIIEHIKARVIFYLNEDETKHSTPYWLNGIKVDVNNQQALGAIGFKAFGESINGIVKQYIGRNPKTFNFLLEKEFGVIDNDLNVSAKYIVNELILPAWDAIFKRWTKSFKETKNVQNEETEKTFYNKDYYIQQTMGVKSLHGLLTELYKEDNCINKTVEKFTNVIETSSLSSEDWKRNGKMRGLSSEAGYKIIQEMIIKRT